MAGFGSSWLPMMTDPYAIQAQTAQNPATQLPPGWMATPEAQALADQELRKKQGLMGPPMPPAKPKMAPTPPPQPPRGLQGPDPSTTDITARSDYDELVARLNAKGLDSLQQQQGGLDDLRQKIALQLQHSEPQLDLTPLLALTDTWSGSNLAQSYQRPGFEKNQETVRQLEGALRQGQNAMSDNEIGLLRGQLGIEESKLNREQRAQERADALQARRDAAAQAAADRALRREEMDANRQLTHREHFEKNFGGKLRDSEKFHQQLTEFQDLIARNNGLPVAGPERQRAESLYSDLTVAYKNPAGLGALAGPDKDIIRGVLGPDTLAGFAASELFKGGAEGVTAALQDVARRNQNAHEQLYTSAHQTYQGSGADRLLNTHAETKSKLFAPKKGAASAPVGAPEVGTVDGGYRFKGGNPSDPNAWEKVQ